MTSGRTDWCNWLSLSETAREPRHHRHLRRAREVLGRDLDAGGREPLDGARRVTGALRGGGATRACGRVRGGGTTRACVRGRRGVTTRAGEPDLAGVLLALGRALVGGRTSVPRGVPARMRVGTGRRCKVGRALDPDEAGRRGVAEDGVTGFADRRAGLGVTVERSAAVADRRGTACRGADLGVVATSRSLYCVTRRGSGGAWRVRTSGDQPSPGARAARAYMGRSRRGLGKTTRVPA